MTQDDYHCLFSDLFLPVQFAMVKLKEAASSSQEIKDRLEKAEEHTTWILWDYLVEIYNEKLPLALKLVRVGAWWCWTPCQCE